MGLSALQANGIIFQKLILNNKRRCGSPIEAALRETRIGRSSFPGFVQEMQRPGREQIMGKFM